MIQQVVILLRTAFEIFATRDPRTLRLTLLGAALLAAFCWIICSRYWRLWNLRFRMKPLHHMLCGLGALTTLVFAISFQALRFTEVAADRSIADWQLDIRNDQSWANSTFRQTWFQVRDLGLEDFTGKPAPSEPDALIPISHEESRRVAAQIYSDAACRHFNTKRPLLSKVVWARPVLPGEVVAQDIAKWQADHSEPYDSRRAIDLVADHVRLELRPQLPRLVRLSRLTAFILFLLGQAIPFCLIGFAAYRDLKEQL